MGTGCGICCLCTQNLRSLCDPKPDPRVQKTDDAVRADTSVRMLGWGVSGKGRKWSCVNGHHLSVQDLGQSPGNKQQLRDR